jgi:hypothetical protein
LVFSQLDELELRIRMRMWMRRGWLGTMLCKPRGTKGKVMFFRKKATRAARTMTFAALALAVGAMVLIADSAGAAPLGLGKGAINQSSALEGDVTLVRDGCGRGMRFSNRRQVCVEDFDRGPPVVVAPGCPRGMRFSNSRGRCVPAGGGVDPGVAIIQGIIGGAVNSGRRGDGCGPGMRFSNSRQRCVPN